MIGFSISYLITVIKAVENEENKINAFFFGALVRWISLWIIFKAKKKFVDENDPQIIARIFHGQIHKIIHKERASASGHDRMNSKVLEAFESRKKTRVKSRRRNLFYDKEDAGRAGFPVAPWRFAADVISKKIS